MIKILVLSVGISKEKKNPYITFRVWNEQYQSWTTEKRSDGYHDFMMTIDKDDYDYIKENLGAGLVVDCETRQSGMRVIPSKLVF